MAEMMEGEQDPKAQHEMNMMQEAMRDCVPRRVSGFRGSGTTGSVQVRSRRLA